jgi:hypothetical protein
VKAYVQAKRETKRVLALTRPVGFAE